MRVRAARLNSVAIHAGVAAFVVLELLAMRFYPGGTWWDKTSVGARFWQNFLCDLEWRVALDGTPNPVGSAMALGAMLVIAATLVPFWLAAARAIGAGGGSGCAKAVRALGLASVCGIVGVVLMPSDRFGAWHGAAVVAAGLPGLSAAALAIVGLTRAGAPVTASIGGLMLAFAAMDFVLYAVHLATHTQGTPLVVVAQKCALGLLLAWMLAVAGARRPHAGS